MPFKVSVTTTRDGALTAIFGGVIPNNFWLSAILP